MRDSVLERFSGRRILEQTPDTLDALLASTTAEDRDWQPNPERWSVNMVLAHLADVEVNAFGKRFRAMAEGDSPMLPVYDQEGFFGGKRFDGVSELSDFRQRRQNTLAWLVSLPASLADRTGRHGELGPITFGQLLHEFAFHDLGHIPFQKYFKVNP
jgi:hypothetical protein